MSSSLLSRYIQYYRQCYQSSFHANEGHGLFERSDVTPLQVLGSENTEQFCLTENQLSAWLVDSDQQELVLFSGFYLKPSPNRAFTTEVHYAPSQILTTVSLIEQSLKNDKLTAHFQHMLQSIDIAGLKEQDTQFDDILASNEEALKAPRLVIENADLPLPEKLNSWLIRQTKKQTSPALCELQVLALVPKDLKSYQAKEAFIQHLDQLAKNANTATEFPVLNHVLLQENELKQATDVRNLLGKVEGLGFGKKLALPSLSARQTEALQNAFRYPISLLQGPPGTGKTHALASLTVVLASLNKAVLLTAQSDAALDVLQTQLTEALNVDRSMIVRFGKGQRHGRFAQQLKRLIQQANQSTDSDDVLHEFESLLALYGHVESVSKRIEEMIASSPTPSTNLLEGQGSLSERFKRWWFWQRQHAKQGSLKPALEQLHKVVDEHHTSLGAVASAVLKQRFQRAYRRDSKQWAKQSGRIGKHTVNGAARQMKAEGEHPVMIQSGLGIWLATLDDVPECTYGNFDWVVIDEATQTNMASVLPALAIAKSLVVAGDPRQLRHYSFLSNDQEERIERELKLTSEPIARFRSTSFFDHVNTSLMSAGRTKAITLLDEHYRSAPPLMKFNSEQFYNDEVKVLTGLEQTSGNALHLDWRYIKGQRIDKVNQAEIEAIIHELKTIITKQEGKEKSSLGVLSFFADQTDALKKAILGELTLQHIRDHQIKVGTPYSFQGAERDHMLISCAVDEDSVAGTWNYLNKPDVFNVATSRARLQQTMFLSIPAQKIPANATLKIYHDFSLPSVPVKREDTLEPWLTSIIQTLTATDAQLAVEHHHRIADIDIDLLLRYKGKQLAIDLIGFPGDLGSAVHLDRYCTLERVGIALYPLTAFDWMFNPETVLQDISQWLHHKDDRLNQRRSVSTGQEQPASSEIVTAPFLGPAQMSLVNEQVWRSYLEHTQAPELSEAWGFHLSEMTEKLIQMDQLLPKLFEAGSVTYLRYKSAINTALTPFMENLSTYRLLHAQVWDANHTDTEYWQTLTKPILERHEQISSVLIKLHREMQLEVAKGGKVEAFALQDIESLTERLDKY